MFNTNGYLFEQNNSDEFLKYLSMFYENDKNRLEMGKNAFIKAQEFEITNSLSAMKKIYNYYLISK